MRQSCVQQADLGTDESAARDGVRARLPGPFRASGCTTPAAARWLLRPGSTRPATLVALPPREVYSTKSLLLPYRLCWAPLANDRPLRGYAN